LKCEPIFAANIQSRANIFTILYQKLTNTPPHIIQHSSTPKLPPHPLPPIPTSFLTIA
jgi:hypothetical protein